jgi:hypothetical protein
MYVGILAPSGNDVAVYVRVFDVFFTLVSVSENAAKYVESGELGDGTAAGKIIESPSKGRYKESGLLQAIAKLTDQGSPPIRVSEKGRVARGESEQPDC